MINHARAAAGRANRPGHGPAHQGRPVKRKRHDATNARGAGSDSPPASSVRVVPVPDQGIEAVAGRAVRGPFPRHAHRRLVVGVVDDGERFVALEGAEHRVGPGELFVIPAGRGHACRSGRDGHGYRLVCLPPGVRPELDAVCSPRVRSPEAARAMDALFALLPPSPATLPRRETLVPELLDLVARAADIGPATPPQPPHAGVERAARAIAADPAAPHSLDDLAAVAQLSKYHLHRLFVSGTGVSPADFRLHCRVRLALELLSRGTPLAETALACGFADQSHFTKAFSRAVGAPPGRFVRDNPPGDDERG